ncbi:MAG: T9SS type A sorting domain-containing protein [Ignavibacteriaceae bacterium]|nr:T9SS type A sorting domain-containing protein [Ignavibacteriaceae bacterium]
MESKLNAGVKKLSTMNAFILLFFIGFQVQIFPQSNPANIYLDSTKQLIQGFGAANIVGWRPDMTDNEITKAFGTGNGQLGFTVLRLRVPHNSNDFSLQVPTAKKAYDLGVKIIASPWTPPASMKTNNNIVGGELKESSYADYAAHLKSFADYMAANGVPLYAISVQNEPDITVTYESCDWNPSQMVKFISENASSIGTRIIAPESFQFLRPISDAILNDSAACANVDIIGGHIYGGGLAPYPLAEQKGKEIWMTEHLTESAHSANIWSYALAVGLEMQNVMLANMSSYIWWYIVRYYGPIADGEKSSSFPNENFSAKGEITKKGYVMSQFARFVRPGYSRLIATAFPQRDITITAYKGDSKVVVVVVNNSTASKQQTFSIQNGTVTQFTPYTTSETKNCEEGSQIQVTNGSFTLNLDASSITTLVADYTPVPVELNSFSAEGMKDGIQLIWETSSELNNKGFEIERSSDNITFLPVGFVIGKGTTTEKQTYSFFDKQITGKFYYRLKQTDFNGTYKYSNVIYVSTLPNKYSLSQNFPNPFNPSTKIEYSIPKDDFVVLKIFDVKGEEVIRLVSEYQSAGFYSALLDGTNLTSGVYYYQLSSGNFMQVKKLVLLK